MRNTDLSEEKKENIDHKRLESGWKVREQVKQLRKKNRNPENVGGKKREPGKTNKIDSIEKPDQTNRIDSKERQRTGEEIVSWKPKTLVRKTEEQTRTRTAH